MLLVLLLQKAVFRIMKVHLVVLDKLIYVYENQHSFALR